MPILLRIPKIPNKIKIPEAIFLTTLSGTYLCSAAPRAIPMPSATSIPAVVPIKMVRRSLPICAESATVASCVLSPISARKKAIATVQKMLKRFFSASLPSSSSFKIHKPKTMNATEATKPRWATAT